MPRRTDMTMRSQATGSGPRQSKPLLPVFACSARTHHSPSYAVAVRVRNALTQGLTRHSRSWPRFHPVPWLLPPRAEQLGPASASSRLLFGRAVQGRLGQRLDTLEARTFHTQPRSRPPPVSIKRRGAALRAGWGPSCLAGALGSLALFCTCRLLGHTHGLPSRSFLTKQTRLL